MKNNVTYNCIVEQLKYGSISGIKAILVMIGFSFIIAVAIPMLSRRINRCDNDACRTPQMSVGNVTSIVGKKLNLHNELNVISGGKGMAILLSTGCSACKKVNYRHLAAIAKAENLALIWITSIDPAIPPDNIGFLKSKIDMVKFSSLVAATPSLSSVAPQVLIVDKSGLVKEHLIGAEPINRYEVVK
jgi:hypothetical protein